MEAKMACGPIWMATNLEAVGTTSLEMLPSFNAATIIGTAALKISGYCCETEFLFGNWKHGEKPLQAAYTFQIGSKRNLARLEESGWKKAT
jgi:hypothetical protein